MMTIAVPPPPPESALAGGEVEPVEPVEVEPVGFDAGDTHVLGPPLNCMPSAFHVGFGECSIV